MARLTAAVRRHPGILVGLSYLVVGVAVLAASIRPGRTLVAADVLSVVEPFKSLPTAGTAHNQLLSDIPFQFFPWLTFLGDALRSGHFPTWNPTLLGGVPLTPNGYVSVYYPAFWLVRWLSPFDAFNLFVLFHLVWGALGVYIFSRVVGARPWPAWAMGLLGFAAAFWVHWSMHLVHLVGFVWLAWALAAAHLLVVDPRRKRVAALAVVIGLWWLGANPQYAYYGTLALVAYAGGLVIARRATGGLLTPALGFLAAVALGAALAAPVLLPTSSVADRILRVREPLPQDHVPRRDIIRVLVPDALGNPADGVFLNSNDELRMDSPFVGVVAALFAAVALGGAALGGRRRPERLLLIGGAVVVLVLAFDALPNQVLYRLLPGYDRFRGASRWLSVLPAFALPLAALGLQDVLDGVRRARAVAAAVCGGAALVVLAWYLTNGEDAYQTYLGKRAAFALAGIALVAAAVWLVRRWPKVALAVVVVAVLGEVAFHTPRWYPSVVEKDAYPELAVADIAAEQGGRLIHVGERTTFPPFAPDLPMQYGLTDAQGLAPLFPRDYDRYLRIVDDYGGHAVALNAAPPLLDGTKLASPLLDALDVRTVIAPDGVAIPEAYPRLNAGSPAVYARSSLGPAAVVPVAQPATEEEMWEHVAAPGWDPARTASVVGLSRAVRGGTGIVSGGATSAGSERWQVDASQGGFLRVSGNWDEGWSARVDGKRVDVLRADGVFRGVEVPAGVSEVTFAYVNPAESRGRLVALAGLVLLLGIAFAPERWWRPLRDPVSRAGAAVVASRFPDADAERKTRIGVGVGVHVATLAIGFVGVVWLNRDQWFFGDEWAFLGPRGVLHGQPGLFAPHNEHWSTLPVLVYRGLYSLFGVRSYLPYVLVLAVVHVVVAHLLWRVMRRSGVDVAVATALCTLFLFLGAGSENILWAFQIGFVGSVACGLGALLLVDRDGAFDWPPGRREVAVWAVLVLGLMCSGIGVPMVAVAGVAVVLRRGFGRAGLGRAALVVSVPGAVYLAWLLLAGRDGIGDRSIELSKLPAYLGTGVSNAFSTTLGSPLLALVAVAGLVGWMAWRRRLAVTSATPAFACAVGVALLFAVLALGRAGLGTAQAEASRYVYLAIALALPVVGLLLTDLAVRSRAAGVAVVALVVVLAAYNLLLLDDRAGEEAARERRNPGDGAGRRRHGRSRRALPRLRARPHLRSRRDDRHPPPHGRRREAPQRRLRRRRSDRGRQLAPDPTRRRADPRRGAAAAGPRHRRDGCSDARPVGHLRHGHPRRAAAPGRPRPRRSDVGGGAVVRRGDAAGDPAGRWSTAGHRRGPLVHAGSRQGRERQRRRRRRPGRAGRARGRDDRGVRALIREVCTTPRGC